MQLSAPLLIAASLAAAALAARHSISVGEILRHHHHDAAPASADSLSGTRVGQGTWFNVSLGACGITNTDSDLVVAVSHSLFDNYPGYDGGNSNKNPVCGTKITATYQGMNVTTTVTDRCVGCKENDLDFSPGAFQQLSDLSVGRLDGVSWSWGSS